MPRRPVFRQILVGALVLLLVAICISCETSAPPTSLPLPTERPKLTVPSEFELAGLLTALQDQKVAIDNNVENHLFRNCEVWIASDGIEVSSSKFENSMVFVDNSSSIVFNQVIFKDLNQYEKATLSINNSTDVVVENCQFVDNYIGLGIHSSSVEVVTNRFEGNNGHNALVIGEGSSVKVTGNYFYGSFPHAILVLNREGSAEARVDITDNLIDQTGEDAIDFEDYRNAAPSNLSNNVITNSGWSALVVEYNSWEANITMENNWIEGTGINWKLPVHPLQLDQFQLGWGHGILVEDSSKVWVMNNRILSAAENGIEIKNGRSVVVQGNGINCSQAGIGAHRYEDASLHRSFSPLAQENADGSQVIASSNIIYAAQKDYDVDEWSQSLAR